MPMGRRLPDVNWPDYGQEHQPGDFWYVRGGPHGDGTWCVCAPEGSLGLIPHHVVEEHEDGMITVDVIPGGEANSIQIATSRPDADGNMQPIELWHGYIRHGVWESV